MRFGYRREKIFLAVEGVLYIGFLLIDWFRQDMYILSDFLKYASIVGCVFYTFLQGRNAASAEKWRKMALAGAALLLADFFLLFTERHLCGVALFLVVQLCYFSYLLTGQGRGVGDKAKWIAIRAGASLLLGACLALAGIPVDWLLFASLFYFANFLGNVLEAGKLPFGSHKLFRLGIYLFFLCDIHVAIFNGAAYGVGGFGLLEEIAGWAMWLYYLPGQALLALSSIWEA